MDENKIHYEPTTLSCKSYEDYLRLGCMALVNVAQLGDWKSVETISLEIVAIGTALDEKLKELG